MRFFAILAACVVLAGCTKGSTEVPTVGDDAGEVTGPVLAEPANAAGAAAGMTPVPIESGVANLSADNTKIQFIGRHSPDKNQPRTGVFTEFTGRAEVDESTRQLTAVVVEIQTESVTTEHDGLTNHLQGPDFFDFREYPVAKFESTSIEAGDDEYSVTGNLTLRETTKELTFPATVAISAAGLTLTGQLTINRSDFDFGAGQDGVASEIALTVVIGEKSALPAAGQAAGGGRRGGGGGRDPAAMFASQDADGDGKLVGDEIPAWIRINLAEFDTDGDEAVSREELQARMAQFGGGGGGGGEGRRGGGGRGGRGGMDPAERFAGWDADDDGKLSGDEIPEWMQNNLTETDTDGDGAISLEEMQARMRSRGGGRQGGQDQPE